RPRVLPEPRPRARARPALGRERPASAPLLGLGSGGRGPEPGAAARDRARSGGALRPGEVTIAPPPRLEELRLPAPGLTPPATLATPCSTTPLERAGHTYGKSFRDVVRALRRDFAHPPDVVAFPRTEDEVTAVLDWCAGAKAAVIPYGGGSSVVGGVEPAVGARYAG